MKKTPEQLVIDIQEACKQLGWFIGMNDSAPGINGIIIGRPEYVENVVDQLEDVMEYSIYSNVENLETGMH